MPVNQKWPLAIGAKILRMPVVDHWLYWQAVARLAARWHLFFFFDVIIIFYKINL
jgi:hypothetical protein